MIILKKADGLSNVEMVLTAEGLTWMELSDEFVNFLQACGYIVQGYEVGDHLCTQYAFQKEEEKNAIREQLEDEIDLASYQERKNEEEVNLSPKRKRRKKNARTLQKR